MRNQGELSIAFIGAGPRTTGILERLAKNSGNTTPPIHIHIIEPFEPGSGRIWRPDQSPLLTLNTRAGDVTLFTDASVQMAGPTAPGPSLIEWAVDVRHGRIRDLPRWEPVVQAELEALDADSFPSRVLHAQYLQWCYARAIKALPAQLSVTVHQCRADTVTQLAMTPLDVGQDQNSQDQLPRHQITLSNGAAPLTVNAVVTATGYQEPEPLPNAFSRFADRHGLWYQPPSFTSDADFSGLPAGAEVIVCGMGLAFIDAMVLLMEGRGGRFVEATGRLRYRPSGREPRLLVGSRRGVPYRSKPLPILRGDSATLRYLTPAVVDDLLHKHQVLDFARHLRPLVLRELAYGHYREIGTGHPHRLTGPWTDLQAVLDCDGSAQGILPMLSDPKDLLDLAGLGQPLRDTSVSDLQGWMARYLDADLQLRSSEQHSESYGLFLALLSCHRVLSGIPRHRLSPESLQELGGAWHSFFSFIVSGPPPTRLRELRAIQDAGLITFLGAGLEVGTDESSRRFMASSAVPSVGTVSATALLEAYLPAHSHPMAVDSHARVLGPDGLPIPGRFALGPFTAAATTGAFSRPGSNAPAFRENDALARLLLSSLQPGFAN